MLGLSGCPRCDVPKVEFANMQHNGMRQDLKRNKKLIEDLRQLKIGPNFKGRAKRIKDQLASIHASPFHLECRNPFFYVPWAEYVCFALDRLHTVYVAFEVKCALPLLTCSKIQSFSQKMPSNWMHFFTGTSFHSPLVHDTTAG